MRVIPLDYDYGDVCAFFQVHGVVPGFVLLAFRGRTWVPYDPPGHSIEISSWGCRGLLYILTWKQ